MKIKNEYKKVFFVMAVLIMISAIILGGVSITIVNRDLDVKNELIRLLKKHKVNEITIIKNESKVQENNYFNENDFEYVNSMGLTGTTEIFALTSDNFILSIQFDDKANDNNKLFYTNNSTNYFQKVDDWNKYKLIGSAPTKSGEIVISKYLADMILKFGVKVLESNSLGIYKPLSYKELVSTKKRICFTSDSDDCISLVITGIIDEDMPEYNILKTFRLDNHEMNGFERLIGKFYQECGASGRLNMIYVSDDFFDITSFKENNQLVSSYRYISYKVGDKYVTPQGWFEYPNRDIQYYDGEKVVSTNSLAKDEVIIHMPYLKTFTKTTSFDDYRDAIRKDCDDTLDLDECVYKFLNDNKIIGSMINIEITDTTRMVTGKGKNEYENLKIVGYAISDGVHHVYEYFSKELLEPYMVKNSEVIALKISDISHKDLENIISNFEVEPVYDDKNVHYYIETPYNYEALNMKDILKKESNCLKIISAVLFIISVCLFIFMSKKKS